MKFAVAFLFALIAISWAEPEPHRYVGGYRKGYRAPIYTGRSKIIFGGHGRKYIKRYVIKPVIAKVPVVPVHKVSTGHLPGYGIHGVQNHGLVAPHGIHGVQKHGVVAPHGIHGVQKHGLVASHGIHGVQKHGIVAPYGIHGVQKHGLVAPHYSGLGFDSKVHHAEPAIHHDVHNAGFSGHGAHAVPKVVSHDLHGKVDHIPLHDVHVDPHSLHAVKKPVHVAAPVHHSGHGDYKSKIYQKYH